MTSRRPRSAAPSARLAPLLALLLVAVAGLGGTASAEPRLAAPRLDGPEPIYSEQEEPSTVIGVRRIGTSVDDRPIRAYHLGNPDARTTAVVLGSMHGNEKAGISVVDALRDGKPVKGVDLWVIPTINPDGVAANTRQNSRGVDLNRNFRANWAPLTGSYYSGTGPFSEPESRAFKRFVNRVDPKFIVSFHQPLYGVGRAGERRPFLRRLSKGLDLPIKSFNCSGQCHGTMTSWFNANHSGTAITVEFGSSPSQKYLRGKAAIGTLAAVLGRH
jgi:murein peptide amidase A